MSDNSVSNLTEKQHQILERPLFVVGAPRSGTTWTQRLLLEHPAIAGGQESEFFLLFGESFNSIAEDEKQSNRVGLSSYLPKEDFYEGMLDLWKRTFIRTLENKPSAELLLEKTPTHAIMMDHIKTLLPKARFIHVIRDSRSVSASVIAASKGWGAHWAKSDVKDVALDWWKMVNVARKHAKALNLSKDEYLEVHYEDLLNNTKEELIRIYDYLGLDWTDEMIDMMIENQSMAALKKSGASGIKDMNGKLMKEPAGFLRNGKVDSWTTDLNWYQKLVIWRYTKTLMKQCGYNWAGRVTNSNKES